MEATKEAKTQQTDNKTIPIYIICFPTNKIPRLPEPYNK
jgi:hypothetical protein